MKNTLKDIILSLIIGGTSLLSGCNHQTENSIIQNNSLEKFVILETSKSLKRPTNPQNIVLILLDDVGKDMVRTYDDEFNNPPNPSYPTNTTPVIDYLAENGLTFRNMWVSPMCSPTRAQILTGKPNLRTGIGTTVQLNLPITNGAGLQPSQEIIPTVLVGSESRPYASIVVGKWHLADASQSVLHPLGSLNNPWFNSYAGAMNNIGSFPGGNNNHFLKYLMGETLPQGIDDCIPPAGGYCETIVDGTFSSVDTTDDAITAIKQLPEPFFIYFTPHAPHSPIDEPNTVPQESFCQCSEGVIHGDINYIFTGQPSEDTRTMLQIVDNDLGRLVCAIETDPQKPILPTTIMVIGDNGTTPEAIVPPFNPEHGKGTLYQGGINVPFIVYSPIVNPNLRGTTTDALVSATDIYATMAEIARAPLPDDPYNLRDSRSFLRVLTGHSVGERSYVYSESFRRNFAPTQSGVPPSYYQPLDHQQAVMGEDGYKLIRRSSEGPSGTITQFELFGPGDLYEETDLMDKVRNRVEPYVTKYKTLIEVIKEKYPPLIQD
ncbi:MAG: sulfatase-like hydrolase/transferase [archaeon]